MNNTKEFADILKGCRPIKDNDGNIIIQTIMNMQIVGLTTDDEYSLDDRFENPLKSLVASNSTYGQIKFHNKSKKEVIIPPQTAVMTKQYAQNHSMIKAGYVKPNARVQYNDAGCVQGSQGGTFNNTNEFRFSPIIMREMLFDSVGKHDSYSRTYPAVRKLGQDTKSNTGEYLDKYFTKYDKKLDEFIAHFELPDKLIGLIVFIDGEIVSIDKFPSFTYGKQIWDTLIRDCYGSLAIMNEIKKSQSHKRFTLKYNKYKGDSYGNIVDKIEKVLNEVKDDITKDVYNKIDELMNLEFNATYENDGHSTDTNVKSEILKTNGYVGQLISEQDYNHLVSIVKRESFNPSELKRVNVLRNKARNQRRFEL